MADALIFDHVRTPRGRGKKDGALYEVPAVRLAAQPLEALRNRNDLDTKLVDDVVLGCVDPIGESRTCSAGCKQPNSKCNFDLNLYATVLVHSSQLRVATVVGGLPAGASREQLSEARDGLLERELRRFGDSDAHNELCGENKVGHGNQQKAGDAGEAGRLVGALRA